MLEYMLYTRALENVVLWGLLILPLLELAALCAATLNNLPPQRRRGLFALFFIMLGLAAVLFGGAWVLERHGLAWRTGFQVSLSLILWLVGLTTGLMTVAYAGRWLSNRSGTTVNGVVTGLSVCCLISAMLVGTVLGGIWSVGPSEQVVTYQGQKMILGKWDWMDTSYALYEYHSPLVRGAGPAVVDFQLIDVKGAVIGW